MSLCIVGGEREAESISDVSMAVDSGLVSIISSLPDAQNNVVKCIHTADSASKEARGGGV